MEQFLGILTTARDLLVFLAGFGLIVFVHELGHFVAARWAGIRVLAFAIGFGPALVSYRKGLGLRRGTSEGEYRKRLEAMSRERPGEAETSRGVVDGISPTEYRLNVLPFGGYVKMLGQEDLDPGAVSAAADGYQRCVPWKRMVVISAGVVMNVVFAGALFCLVYLAGKPSEPAVVGGTYPDSPASRTVAANAAEAGVSEPGLMAGDRIVSVDGRAAREFNDALVSTAMSDPGESVEFVVRRPGVEKALVFRMKPETSAFTGLLEVGIDASRSSRLFGAKSEEERSLLERELARAGVIAKPGMRLVSVDGAAAGDDLGALIRASRGSGGRPLRLEFEGLGGERLESVVKPRPMLQTALVTRAKGTKAPVEHLLGLVGVMKVAEAKPGENAYAVGLREGDVFARLGNLEYPSVAKGMDEIQAHAGKHIPIVVLRKEASGAVSEVAIDGVVKRDGRIGFSVGDTSRESGMMALPIAVEGAAAGRGLVTVPGTTVVAVDGRAIGSLGEMREALREETREAFAGGRGAVVPVSLKLPAAGSGNERSATVSWSLAVEDVRALHGLGWESPIPSGLFEPAMVVRRASGPVEAVEFGLSDTKRVMATTYLTFLRLFQQSVKIEHLKGPVGIAHIGTMVANRGLVQLLFFMALISVNLAVINFLPLPIVDGGQFLLLVAEQIRGRPVPASVQNGLTLAGLVLIGSVFLVVTFNDVRHLLGL